MSSLKDGAHVARMMGVLFLVQGATGYLVNFVLLAPVLSAPQGFLASAAGSALQVRMAVLLGLANGALTVGIAIAAWPVFRLYSQRMAIWYLALSVIGFSLLALENVSILSMLSLSQEYAKAGAPQELLQTMALAVRSTRYWTHYTNLLIAGGTVFVFYTLLWRFALVPRALAAFGLVAVALQITAVTMPILGYPIVFFLIAPLGLSQLILVLWLVTKGFKTGHPLRAVTESPSA